MKGRHQGGALATGRHVATPEVGHGGDAGALGDEIGIADLQAVAMGRAGLMAHRLAVTADGANGGRRHAGLVEQGQDSVGKTVAEFHVGHAQSFQFIVTRTGQGIDLRH